MSKRKYGIGDRVYHVLPESEPGVVIDARYYLYTCKWEYHVAFSAHTESLWYYEHELSPTKTF